jgi:type II secretory pathway pseudopilin PulG
VLSLLHTEEGFTLMELLVAVLLLMIAVTATLAGLNGFINATGANFSQNVAQSDARTAVDRMARELRATASPGLPNAPIERAQPDELVFDSVDPAGPSGANATAVARFRYCLNTTTDKLWKQIQSWTTATRPALSASTTCPDSSFGTQTTVAEYVVNDGTAPLRTFSYDSTTASDVGAVTLNVYTDANVNKAPGAQRLKTTVYLRNLNRPPTAGFSATLTGSRHVLLNAGPSTDADGDPLSYQWYDGGTAIGTGAVLDYASPSTGDHTFTVKVTDTSGLSTTSTPQTVSVS